MGGISLEPAINHINGAEDISIVPFLFSFGFLRLSETVQYELQRSFNV